jgi:hypothetical protein
MLASFQAYLRYSAIAVLIPEETIFATVMAINFVGDGLRDALDPWLRNRQIDCRQQLEGNGRSTDTKRFSLHVAKILSENLAPEGR